MFIHIFIGALIMADEPGSELDFHGFDDLEVNAMAEIQLINQMTPNQQAQYLSQRTEAIRAFFQDLTDGLRVLIRPVNNLTRLIAFLHGAAVIGTDSALSTALAEYPGKLLLAGNDLE